MPTQFSVLGKTVRQYFARQLVTGQLKYTADLQLPGMLHAKILRNPYPHAKVTSIDTSKAEALPGVKGVVTFKDAPGVYWTARALCLSDESFVFGQAIAAVAAETEETAEEALELIEVKYDIRPFVIDPADSVKPETPKIFPQGNYLDRVLLKRGDVEKGFAEADLILEDTYRTPCQIAGCTEPRCAIAYIDAEDRITIYDTSRNTFAGRDSIASALKIPASRIRVIQTITQSWGDRGAIKPHNFIAALLAVKTRRPVKLEYNIEEQLAFGAIHGKAATVQRVKVGVKKDGTLTAIKVSVTAQSGAFVTMYGDSESCLMWIYHCPNVLHEGRAVFTNTREYGSVRCLMHPVGTLPLELHMDTVAEKLGMDPVEFKTKNRTTPEEGTQGAVAGKILPWSSHGYAECLQKGVAIFGWKDKWKGWGKPTAVVGAKRRGVGFATHTCRHGNQGPPMSGIVKVNTDGSAHLLTGAAELGEGCATTLAMIAAEELGVRYEDMSVTHSDTASTQDTGTTAGSRMTASGGTGAKLAAADAKQQLFEIAAPLLGVKVEDLEAKDGNIYVKAAPDKKMSIAAVAQANPKQQTIIGRGAASVTPGYDYGSFNVCFAEVEVDTETGEVTVLNTTTVEDMGTMVNRVGAERQVISAHLWGKAYGFYEDHLYDKPTGIPLTRDFIDYKVLSIKDTHKQQNDICTESYDMMGPFGAKGTGEPPKGPAAPAIANAVYNAIGVRLKEFPATPDVILKALKAKGGA